MLNPNPIIPNKIIGVDLLNNNKKKNPTMPNPIITKRDSFGTFEDKYAVNSRPVKIIIQSTLAVICDKEAGSKLVSLK